MRFGMLYPRCPRIEGIKDFMWETLDNYNLWQYVMEVERMQDGIKLPYRWRRLRRWLQNMPISRLKARVNYTGMYYMDKFGYVRNGDVYEVDEKCVGVICMVVILVSGGISIAKTAEVTGLSEVRVRNILKNYKYYVGWHNAYTEDGRRIWPAIREIELLHKDVIECE